MNEIRTYLNGRWRYLPINDQVAEMLIGAQCVQEYMRTVCETAPDVSGSVDPVAWDAAVDHIREKHATEFYRNGQPRLIIGAAVKDPEPYLLESVQAIAQSFEALG